MSVDCCSHVIASYLLWVHTVGILPPGSFGLGEYHTTLNIHMTQARIKEFRKVCTMFMLESHVNVIHITYTHTRVSYRGGGALGFPPPPPPPPRNLKIMMSYRIAGYFRGVLIFVVNPGVMKFPPTKFNHPHCSAVYTC